MDLNRVAVFVRVVEEGGVTAAARALGLPKSSVSRAVALLEQELGVLLLQRSTRKVTLTEAGGAFYDQASRGIAAVREAGAAVADMESAVRGPIRITAPLDVGAWLLAPIVGELTRRHPEVRVEVRLTGRVVDLVEEGIDLALRASELRDGSLIARRLRPLGAALYASRAYLAAHGAPKRLADLAAHRCVLFRGTRGRARWTLRGPDGDESVDVTGPVDADDFVFVRQAVAAGAGIGLMPTFVAEAPGGRLVRVLRRWAQPISPLWIGYPSARYLPRRVALLRDLLIERLGG